VTGAQHAGASVPDTWTKQARPLRRRDVLFIREERLNNEATGFVSRLFVHPHRIAARQEGMSLVYNNLALGTLPDTRQDTHADIHLGRDNDTLINRGGIPYYRRIRTWPS
jgi:hypothetical protein